MTGVGCGWQCGDARHCRLPCTCEWTRPHLLGRFLDRHQGCCSRRGDNNCGHAAVSGRLPPSKINKCPPSLVEGKGRRVNRLLRLRGQSWFELHLFCLFFCKKRKRWKRSYIHSYIHVMTSYLGDLYFCTYSMVVVYYKYLCFISNVSTYSDKSTIRNISFNFVYWNVSCGLSRYRH